MASPAISNPVTNSDRSISRRKKKKKIQNQSQNLRDEAQARTYQWKSDTQQQVYSSKLLQALRQVRISGGGGASPKRGRAVREAADRVLAVSAKGRTRWSRAILTNRIKLKFMRKSSNKRQRVTVTGNNRFHKKPRLWILRLKTKNLPAFQRKARALGRLVPGCRKQPVPVILEEASDYIAALEMQVRAMSALTQLLSGAAASSSSSSNDAALLNQLGSSRHPPPS